MFCRSITIALRPSCTSDNSRSPNSLAVELSSRPWTSMTVTPSLSASTNFIPRTPSSFPDLLHEAQLIDPADAGIFQVIHQVAHEMQADAADLAHLGVQVGRRHHERIERLAIVLHHHL